jgi:putative addiction module CopG family antidote
MNVSRTPELARLVEGQVRGGTCSTASGVVREGFRILAERETLRELRREELRN